MAVMDKKNDSKPKTTREIAFYHFKKAVQEGLNKASEVAVRVVQKNFKNCKKDLEFLKAVDEDLCDLQKKCDEKVDEIEKRILDYMIAIAYPNPTTTLI